MAPDSRRIPLSTGLTYHCLEWDGAGDHTVVLLHGFLDLAWSWVDTVEAGLAGRFHVVAPDLRGHGDSDWVGPGGYYHFLDYLADVHDLVAKLGRARVSLVGHSMGGGVASYYTGSFPSRVHRLALLEGIGPPETEDAGPERTATWLAAWQRVRGKGNSGKTYGSVSEAAARLRALDPLCDEATALRLAEHGTARGQDGRLRFKHDPLHTTPAPLPYRTEIAARYWRNITCPVLLVEGTASLFRHTPEEHARRKACFADVREARLEGAAHMMMRHRPRELAQLLADFLA